ncbi:hypothetical protein FB45DRAFT_45107 [Roridomyces roridus]|uniref:F-box domain-containing protein n=1 Tax=Roridomyces roridus TaxID=1738132 RepID=A0AAD7BS01_9AGAR|nr:hypothetical protein FB45DRAFT_45107 [Roridomyces roridus]
MEFGLQDLPFELKLKITDLLSPGDVASLCATSQTNYTQLTPCLYSRIAVEHNADGMRRGIKLLQTLASPRTNLALLHPATLVRELRLWLSITTLGYHLASDWMAQRLKAMRNLETLISAALLRSAEYGLGGVSLLRVLHVSSNVPVMDGLAPILCMRPQFGRLEEVCVAARGLRRSERAGFRFLEIPGLKSLLHEETANFGTSDTPLIASFVNSLELIPSNSPALTVLHLDLTWVTDDTFPCIESAINSLRLPNLQQIQIRVFLIAHSEPSEPDFHPLLEAHPRLRSVSVPIRNFLNRPLRGDALPVLEVFSGHVEDVLQVCDGVRPLRDLTVSLFDRDSEPKKTQLVLGALIGLPSLQRLALVNRPLYYRAEKADGDEDEVGLDSDAVRSIAEACPNLTHVELHLTSIRDCTALEKVLGLKSLKIHLRMSVPSEMDMDAADLLDDISGAVNQHLVPRLPQLLDIEVAVVGVRKSSMLEPEVRIVYDALHVFDVVRRDGEREAVESEVQVKLPLFKVVGFGGHFYGVRKRN